MDNKSLEAIITAAPPQSRAALRENLPYVVDALANEGILTSNVLAYALATIQHETAGTFQPIEEYYGRSQAQKHGYSGGEEYFGRGYIQLTHDYNYRDIGNKIGMGDQLYENPELALQPDVAAKILAKFFKDRGVANLANSGNFTRARRPINPDDKGVPIANVANSFKRAISDDVIHEVNMTKASNLQSHLPQGTTKGSNQGKMQSENDNVIQRIINKIIPRASAAEPETQSLSDSQINRQEPYSYTVQPGDTLWGIAERNLGSGSKWKSLGYQGDPRQLQVGTQIPMMSQGQATRIPSPRVSAAKNNPTANQIARRLTQDNMQTSGQSAQMQSTVEAPMSRPTYTPRKPYTPPKPAPKPTPQQTKPNMSVYPIATHMSGKLVYSDGSIR